MAKFGASSDGVSFAVLGKAMRPTALVHVGAGYGRGWLHQWHHWNLPTAWVIDADSSKLAWVNKLGASEATVSSDDQPKGSVALLPTIEDSAGSGVPRNIDVTYTKNGVTDVHAVAAVVGEHTGETTFFEASNPEENSLVLPSDLKTIWPNLRVVSEQSTHVNALDDLIPDVPAGAWLVMDCLPALPILKGASKALENAQVVVVRVLLQTDSTGSRNTVTPVHGGLNETAQPIRQSASTNSTDLLDSAAEVAVAEFLSTFGFTVIDRIQSHHPRVGHLLLAKPYSVVDRKEREEQRALNQQAYAALEDQHVALQSSEAMLQQQVRELAAAVSQANTEKQRRESIAAQLQEEKKLTLERQAKIDELTESLRVETQKVTDLATQIDGVNGEKAGLVQQRDTAIQKLSDIEGKVGALSQEIANHIKHRDELAGQIQGFAGQVNSLKQSVEAAQAEKESIRQSLHQEHQAAIQTLQGQHQASVNESNQRIESLNKELEAARASINQLQAQVKDHEALKAETHKLKTQNSELMHRQALMNEELVRAEGQINLIKDLLLADKSV